MKKIAIVLMIIALAALGVTLWGITNATLQVEAEEALAAPADSQRAEFERLMGLLSHDAVRGIVFDKQVTGNPADYTILRYTLRVKNNGFLPAKVLEAVVLPVSGDVLCYSQQDAQGIDVNEHLNLDAGRETRLHCYLLTKKDMHAVREIHVTYYIWGHPFLVKVTYG